MESRIDQAAALLRRAAVDGQLVDGLPGDLEPRDRTEAYAVQARVAELSGQPVVGWKIAATSAAGQAHINVLGPLAATLVEDHVHADGAAVPLAGNAMRLAELEFVFVLGRTIEPRGPRHHADSVADEVADLRLGIELPSTRFTDPTTVGPYQLIADGSCSGRFVLGPVVEGWRDGDLASVQVISTVTGPTGERTVAGVGSEVLGNPLVALAWFLNELSDQGITVSAGQFVTTGTCNVLTPVSEGDRVTATFDGLGTVGCSLV